ncbi:hypothetical protein RND81_09G071100 [Saponaria officinalis]|uniref:CBM20 domain-containing protein n=1 Tax=Saponaria officinalis TaxID=3572 RepID=A0AAW1IJQ1_SAPOF
MGTAASKNSDYSSHGDDDEEDDNSGGRQLFVSLKMQNYRLQPEFIPHVFGSAPLVGSWDTSKALPMERESTSMWELSFVVPPNHETLDFNFLLRSKDNASPYIVEEGPHRILSGGRLQGDATTAVFKMSDDVMLEYRVHIKADRVSPFDLAASWRAYQENLRPSAVRGIPDVSINSVPEAGHENGPSASLELDLEHYVVPSPATSLVYPANLAATPRYIASANSSRVASLSKGSGVCNERPTTVKEMVVAIPDPTKVYASTPVMETKSVATISSSQRQESLKGLFVDRGVGSPRLVKSASAGTLATDMNLGSERKNAMPAAAGAVAAAAVADQMLGPKEDRHLAIVLVGLPARGKTFTAAKLTRYLRWLGHDTKHFNVGKYRRLKLGTNQCADFFRGDNPEGIEARNEVAALAMEDMISWMQEGGQVGIFDATNSTRERRTMLMKLAEGKCKVYEPVEEGSYIKMIDMISGHGGQIQINNISGYLPGRIVFFLVNTQLTPRPILLTRHGESQYNVRARIGGDSAISDSGKLYAKKLANFVEKRLKSERAASIWTSTLQRSILTANHIVGFPKVQWRALDEINAGVCDGMTYEEVKRNMPEEYESRKKDKLRYRYPRGESYLDVIQRLEPVIIELERQRAPVVVVSHQAVLRALYAYFADRPLHEIPNIEVPLHTIIEIQMGVTGVQEKRYKLMD